MLESEPESGGFCDAPGKGGLTPILLSPLPGCVGNAGLPLVDIADGNAGLPSLLPVTELDLGIAPGNAGGPAWPGAVNPDGGLNVLMLLAGTIGLELLPGLVIPVGNGELVPLWDDAPGNAGGPAELPEEPGGLNPVGGLKVFLVSMLLVGVIGFRLLLGLAVPL